MCFEALAVLGPIAASRGEGGRSRNGGRKVEAGSDHWLLDAKSNRRSLGLPSREILRRLHVDAHLAGFAIPQARKAPSTSNAAACEIQSRERARDWAPCRVGACRFLVMVWTAESSSCLPSFWQDPASAEQSRVIWSMVSGAIENPPPRSSARKSLHSPRKIGLRGVVAGSPAIHSDRLPQPIDGGAGMRLADAQPPQPLGNRLRSPTS
ncbi:hypothetical protein QBC47DRAFT_430107 [Echria macrotheca]|uniref:Uncharacterized protein n=1 Tax=Echria macrotheca TaxID=438768 RepID=A0AAJ0B836_9PEZI|nr:hypothetical protein QBC47DRAFT_430107 [Echria macrotheca]